MTTPMGLTATDKKAFGINIIEIEFSNQIEGKSTNLGSGAMA